MILKLYALRDSKAAMFMNPMFLQSRGQALRAITDEVNGVGGAREQGATVLQTHPEDFELFELGSFDTDTGLFDTHQPQSVAVCSDLRIKSN